MSELIQIAYDGKSNIIYKLVLESFFSATENSIALEKGYILTDNTNFKSYEIEGYVPMHGILYLNNEPSEKEIQRIENPDKIIYITETYEEYLNKLEQMDNINTTWIKKIINNESEQDKVIFRNDEFIIVRDWKFSVKYSDKDNVLEDGFKPIFDFKDLHLLGIPCINIKSIRDIKLEHIPLLDKIKKEGIKVCENIFGIDENQIKIYFHYPPSTYHLHIHFTWIGLNNLSTNFERAYDYDSVKQNIKLDPNYYKSDMRHILID